MCSSACIDACLTGMQIDLGLSTMELGKEPLQSNKHGNYILRGVSARARLPASCGCANALVIGFRIQMHAQSSKFAPLTAPTRPCTYLGTETVGKLYLCRRSCYASLLMLSDAIQTRLEAVLRISYLEILCV